MNPSKQYLFPFILIPFGILSLIFCIGMKKKHTNQWQEKTEQELREIYVILKENHPGAIDTSSESLGFKKWLEEEVKTTLSQAKKISSYAEYKFLLRWYVNGFQDNHLSLILQNNENHPHSLKWPGLIIKYDNGSFIVAERSCDKKFNKLPPLGAKLITCNKKTPEEMMLHNCFKFFGKPYDHEGKHLEADWIKFTPFLFRMTDNPFAATITTCTFEMDGKQRKYDFSWFQINDHDFCSKVNNIRNSRGGDPFGIHQFGKNGVWLSIPSFNPQKPANVKIMNTMIDNLKDYRTKSIIVFDVRGNGGGSSYWCEKKLHNLFGEKYINSLNLKSRKTVKDIRVSHSNIETCFQQYAPAIKKSEGLEEFKEFNNQYQALKKALENGESFYRDKTDHSYVKTTTQPQDIPVNPVKAQVYLLTDGMCASATLMFADDLLEIPGVIHIGQPTNADTPYTEAYLLTLPSGNVHLPSGNVQLQCPRKIRRNLPRKCNQPYIPRYRYDGNFGDTQSVKQWVLELDNKIIHNDF